MATQTGSLDLKGITSAYSDQQQYFWVESSSSATWGGGAHITNIAESAFKTAAGTWGTNPTAGGYNLLMNTDTANETGSLQLRNGSLPIMNLDNDSLDFNAIDITDGTYTTVASFGANKAVIGKEDETHAEVSNEGLKVINPETGEAMYIWNPTDSGMVISGSYGTKISGGGVDPYNYIWFDGDLLSNGIPINGIITKHYGYGTNPVWRWDVFAPQERNNGEESIDYVYTARGSVRYDASITITTSSGNGWYRNSSAYTLGIPQKLQKANLYYGGLYGELPHHFVLSSCHISVMCGGAAYYFATPAAWTATQLRYWVGHLGSVSTSDATILVDFSGYYVLDDDAIEPE